MAKPGLWPPRQGTQGPQKRGLQQAFLFQVREVLRVLPLRKNSHGQPRRPYNTQGTKHSHQIDSRPLKPRRMLIKGSFNDGKNGRTKV
jgi:hypothetical protein